MEICNEHGSFLGMTWNQLKAQLNSAEMRKTFVLNPLAPEFVPNRLFHINRMENIHPHVPGFHGQPHHPASASHYMGQRMMYPGAVYPHHVNIYIKTNIYNTCLRIQKKIEHNRFKAKLADYSFKAFGILFIPLTSVIDNKFLCLAQIYEE